MKQKCIVFGCLNHKHEGQFVGDICAPCHMDITTGVVGRTMSFLGKLKRERDLYMELFRNAVEAASPYLQSGGKYAHLLLPGDDIIADGIPALVKEIDRARAEGRREGFLAARSLEGEPEHESFVFPTLEDYGQSIKEEHGS